MGMYDSLYDRRGNEWQTKALGCALDKYSIGDEIVGPPITYQIDVIGGWPEYRQTWATVREGRLHEVPSERDKSLHAVDSSRNWHKPESEE